MDTLCRIQLGYTVIVLKESDLQITSSSIQPLKYKEGLGSQSVSIRNDEIEKLLYPLL